VTAWTNSKNLYICKIRAPSGKICGKRKKESERVEHQRWHKRARVASKKGIDSENKFAKKLRRKYKKSLVFQTGKEAGVPDIILHNNGKLSFYEVKPVKGSGSLLKLDQFHWIKDNCFPKKFDAYLVTYYVTEGGKWIFDPISLNEKNIKKYCCSSKKN